MSIRNYLPIKEGNTVIFYLNTGGFPLANDVWNQMWAYAKELQPNAVEKLNTIHEKKIKIPDVEIPIPPYVHLYNKNLTNTDKLDKIQNYVDKLQYNHTGLQFFEIRKDRPLIGLADLSRKIIEDSLPIKCLEAVILSIYFINEIIPSNELSGVEKFTIGFKTVSKGNVHRHVVLGTYCHSSCLFGALGLSRRSDLGYKKLKYKTLTDLISDYIESYSKYLHKVKRIKIGMPIQSSNRSFETIPWNGCTINFNNQESSEWPKLLEKHSRTIRYNNNNNLKQNNLITLKNSTNLNLKSRKQNSYLNKHLNEIKIKARSESLDPINKHEPQKQFQCIEDDLNDQEDDEDSEQENLESKNEQIIFPKTALNSNLTESIALFSDLSKNGERKTDIFGGYSSLLKRKQVSLRV